jgi:hypothetical protein
MGPMAYPSIKSESPKVAMTLETWNSSVMYGIDAVYIAEPI